MLTAWILPEQNFRSIRQLVDKASVDILQCNRFLLVFSYSHFGQSMITNISSGSGVQ